ncbi:MAG: histone deacetylase [Acidobacteria bacterium]|nr:MAG: histone deacetylase [Acidobacteriota bacterium]
MEAVRPSLMPRFLRRARRRLRGLIAPLHAAVVYHEGYDVAVPGVPDDPLRAGRILAFLAAEGLLDRRTLFLARPASLKSLARVHRAGYLDRLRDPRELSHIMGSEVRADQVDRLLDLQRLETGGTKLATHLALGRRSLTINLGGGFHHARADQGAGFCIFNDVAAAILEARSRGFRGRVLVVDLDLHDGDGTRSIFRHDPDVHTFSIHARDWDDAEAVADTRVPLGEKVGDATYLDALSRTLPPVLEQASPQLVIYLAGVDVAQDDPLGDWRLTAAGVLERDRRVWKLVRQEHRLPLVILLAGGYGPYSWRYSGRFLSLALDGRRAVEPPSTEVMTLERYRLITTVIDPRELSGGSGDDFALQEEDLYLPGWGMMRETRFLGYYTKHGIELVLERGGFLDRLRDLGFEPALELQLDDPGGHALRIWGDPRQRELLVEVRLSRDRRTVEGLELLSIEWLLMQNPRAAFSDRQPPLPGQRHPGLGMAHDVIALLILACERLHLDGLAWVPSHYHTAAPWRDRLVPVRPETAALWHALDRLFDGVSVAAASRALAAGEVVDEATGAPLRWQPAPVVLPVSAAAEAWAAKARARPLPPPPRLAWRPAGKREGVS